VILGKVMKNELEADIPLTDTVLAILREIKEAGCDSKYVFPGLKAGTTCSNNEQHHADALEGRHGAQGDGAWLPLDLPHVGQDETSIEREVLEYCLHHIEGSEAELVYARGDVWEKRKAALQAWETVCNSKPAPKLRLVA
jgi:hypothetical protein